MSLSRSLLVLALGAALSGCYAVKYSSSSNASARASVTERVYVHGLFWGIWSLGEVDIDKHCGAGGVKKIRSQIGGLGLIAYAITGGIWTPMSVKLTCAAPSAAAVEPEGDGQFTWAELEDGAQQ